MYICGVWSIKVSATSKLNYKMQMLNVVMQSWLSWCGSHNIMYELGSRASFLTLPKVDITITIELLG